MGKGVRLKVCFGIKALLKIITETLTLTGTEAIYLVLVVVCSGCTPGNTICAAICGAGGVGCSLKQEGEVTHCTLGVTIAGLNG